MVPTVVVGLSHLHFLLRQVKRSGCLFTVRMCFVWFCYGQLYECKWLSGVVIVTSLNPVGQGTRILRTSPAWELRRKKETGHVALW